MHLSDENKITATAYLAVADRYSEDIGKGIARIDYRSMSHLGAKRHDLIEIIGKRRMVAKCLPLYPSDEGKGIIRIDRVMRLNTGIELGDEIHIKMVHPVPASRVVLEYQGDRERFDFCWGDQKVVPLEAIEYFRGSFKGHNFKTENLSFKKSEDNRCIIVHDAVNTGTLALDEEGKVKFTATFPGYSNSIWGDAGYRWENTHFYYRLENDAINLYHSTAPPPIDELYLNKQLDGLPVLKGDKVLIPLFGTAILFTVIDITPNEANLAGNQTRILQI